MKKNHLTSALVILLSLSVLVTAVLSCWYVQSIRQMRQLQGQVANANYVRNIAQSLANGALEYSRKSPPMDALLKSMTQQQQQAARGVQPIPGLATNQTVPIK